VFVFTEAERVIRSADRAICLNEAGREVLVGLAEEETAVYMDYVRRYGLNKRLWTRARPDKAERETLLELHNKHETARLAAIGPRARSRRKSTKSRPRGGLRSSQLQAERTRRSPVTSGNGLSQFGHWPAF